MENRSLEIRSCVAPSLWVVRAGRYLRRRWDFHQGPTKEREAGTWPFTQTAVGTKAGDGRSDPRSFTICEPEAGQNAFPAARSHC